MWNCTEMNLDLRIRFYNRSYVSDEYLGIVYSLNIVHCFPLLYIFTSFNDFSLNM